MIPCNLQVHSLHWHMVCLKFVYHSKICTFHCLKLEKQLWPDLESPQTHLLVFILHTAISSVHEICIKLQKKCINHLKSAYAYTA